MAREYHVDIAQHAASADAKWLDNLLSRFDIPGVANARQGIPRRVSNLGIYHVVLIRRLTAELGMSTGNAVSVASDILRGTTSGSFLVTPGVELRLDRPAFERDVDGAIEVAVESVSPARRGRPPVPSSRQG